MAKELLLRRGTTAENNLFTGALAEPSYDTDRKELRIHDGSTVGGKVVSTATGSIVAFGGTAAPEGWLICDGSAISRTDYADLFAVIGTNYGDGDGVTTFNVPDYSSVEFITSSGDIGVKGNGKTLGLSTGNTNVAIRGQVWAGSNIALGVDPNSFNQNTGYNRGESQGAGNSYANQALGVVTDATKSGMNVTINAADSSNFIIKY